MAETRTARFSAIFIIGTFCIILCMAAAAFYHIYRQRVNEERAAGSHLVRQVSESISLWLDDRVVILRSLGKTPVVREACLQPTSVQARAAAAQYLRSVHADHLEYTLIGFTSFVIPPEGVAVRDDFGNPHRVSLGQSLVDSVSGTSLGVGGLDFNYIRGVYEGAPAYISEAKANAVTGMPSVFVVAVPVHSDDGSVVGCLYAGIKLNKFSASFSKNQMFGLTGRMEIVDERGVYVTNVDKDRVLQGKPASAALLEALLRGDKTFEIREGRMSRVYTTSEVFPDARLGNRWWVVFRRDLLELRREMAPPLIGLGMIFLTLFLLVAYLIYKMNVHMQRTLAAKALVDELELHKSYQGALQRERTTLRTVLDNVPGIIFLRDKDLRYTIINDHFTQVLGLTQEETEGKADGTFGASELAVCCRETDQAVRESAGAFYFEEAVPHINGSVRDYLFSKEALYDVDGQFMGILGVGFDVTLLKETQRDLVIAKARAEEASRAKSSFLSTVSHEIRTPMNAIVGFVHLFDRANLSERQKDYLEKIRLASNSLLDIINNVLDISKIESGKLEVEHVPFRLDTLLHTLRSIAENAAQAKGLFFIMEVAPRTPRVLMGDCTRVHQVLLNLVSNAIKFTPEGSVHICVGPEAQALPDGRKALGFIVSDTGIGMSQEQLTRVFDPFTQADVSTTRKFGGTGLGLSICKELAEIMGGTIAVDSTQGEGTSFHVRLPLEEAPAGSLEEADNRGERMDLGRQEAVVLLVEDNPINQEIALALLEAHGLIVDTAEDGLVALERAKQRHYDLIFMDVQMPHLDGMETTRRMRALGREDNSLYAWLGAVPIIAMTANAMLEDKKSCLAAGMDDHLGKPLEPQMLEEALLHWLRGVRRTA